MGSPGSEASLAGGWLLCGDCCLLSRLDGGFGHEAAGDSMTTVRNVPKAGIRSGSEITVLGTKQSSKHPAGYRFQRPGPGGAAVIRPRGAACTRSWRDVGGRKRTPNYRACVGNSNAVSPGGKEARATDVNRCAMAKRSVGVFGSDQASLAGIAAGVSRTKYRRSPRLPARSGRRWPGGSGL